MECQLSADQLMEVITDFGSYSDFLPEVKKTTVQLAGPPIWEVLFELQLIRPLQYRLRLEKTSEFTLEWSLIDGFFISNNGSWTIEPGAESTSVCYEIEMHLHHFLPRTISNSLTQRSLPATIQRFVDEATRRAATASH